MKADVLLAVDPSLRGTGFAILETSQGRIACRDFGVIKNPPKLLHSECLLRIASALRALTKKWEPATLAVESVIYVQSIPTAIALGSARGAALLAAAEAGMEVYEYAPRRVKQAVVGRGGAQKEQVGFMVRALLGLTVTPPPDAADAIAIGLTHFQTMNMPVAARRDARRI